MPLATTSGRIIKNTYTITISSSVKWNGITNHINRAELVTSCGRWGGHRVHGGRGAHQAQAGSRVQHGVRQLRAGRQVLQQLLQHCTSKESRRGSVITGVSFHHDRHHLARHPCGGGRHPVRYSCWLARRPGIYTVGSTCFWAASWAADLPPCLAWKCACDAAQGAGSVTGGRPRLAHHSVHRDRCDEARLRQLHTLRRSSRHSTSLPGGCSSSSSCSGSDLEHARSSTRHPGLSCPRVSTACSLGCRPGRLLSREEGGRERGGAGTHKSAGM